MYMRNKVDMLYLLNFCKDYKQKTRLSFLMASHNTKQTLQLPATAH